jgi:site-specific recombinase XerD
MKPPTRLKSVLAGQIGQFLTHKRALGRRYDVEEKTLRLFDRYLAERKVKRPGHVTPNVIEAFLASRPRNRPRSYNHLLGTVRRLFDWLMAQGLLDRSPVRAEPRRQTCARIPFIFDPPMVRRLLQMAKELPDNSRASFRGPTYRTIFAILYGLGLRVGEVCRLRLNDVDWARHVLVIRQTKFYKSRLVPFGPRIAALLEEYRQARLRRAGTLAADAPLFSFTARGEIGPTAVSQVFHGLLPRLALEVPLGCSPPRLHDLRHSFAVGTLLRWYRSGTDPGAGLLKLATFLGHVDPNSTAVYLTITTALLQEANRRFEAFASPAVKEELP